MIRKGSISVPLLEEAVRAGRDNGQRACDVVDEKIEQALFLSRLAMILNGNPFQKVSSLLLERIWKTCSPQRRDNPQAFYSEGMQRFSLGRDPGPLEYRHILCSPL